MLCFVVYRQDSTNGQILRSQGESKKIQWSAEATKCVVPTEILRPLILSKSGIEEVYCRLRSWSRAVAPGGFRRSPKKYFYDEN